MAAGVGVVMVEVVVMVRVWMLLLYPDISQVPVFADEVVHPPVQLFYPGALGLDEALLVLDNSGEFPQIQDRLHWVF